LPSEIELQRRPASRIVRMEFRSGSLINGR